jgi:hypothetical protein
MELHEPVEHRSISNPAFLHLIHSFQEHPFLSEVYSSRSIYCLLAGSRLAEKGQVMTIESHTTEDGSARPLVERLKPEPCCTWNKVAVPGTLAARMGINEIS